MKSRVLLRAILVVGLVAACSDSSNDPGTPGGEVATIVLTPTTVSLEVGATQSFTAVAKDAGGTVVHPTITWSSSTPAVASVDDDGIVTALAIGTTGVTASSGTIHSTAASVTVSAANLEWPLTGSSSSAKIDSAVAAGTLTAEQGLVYKVYGAFADRRLPSQYRGTAPHTIDNPSLGLASASWSSLSPGSRTALAPFFRTPSDPDGWYAARFPSGSGSPGSAPGLRIPETCATLETKYVRRTTQHFAVFYRIGDENGPAMADLITPELEAIWTAEVTLFGRTPVSDAGLTQPHGCDGRLDVWLVSATGELGAGRPEDVPEDGLAWNTKYEPGCTPGPTFLGIWSQPSVDVKKARAALAHEFFHVLERGSYTFGGSCGEYHWLGEATGNWVMDLVAPLDNVEHGWAPEYAGVERLAPIDEPGNGILEESTNGYNDYPFLLYLARTYDNITIKNIWEASSSGNSVDAISAALEPYGGFEDVWPKFALSQWNNYKDHSQDQLHTKDDLIWGMREIFDRGDAGNPNAQRSEAVTLPAAGRSRVGLAALAGLIGFGRLTIHADYLKFPDANVASVVYFNPLALATYPHFKIQALIKIGDSWSEAEDWTHLGAKAWCRDLAAERIQELVLIYTNSSGATAGADADPIKPLALPNVGASNVGCAKWTGTSSVVSTAPLGGSTVSGNDLVFIRERPAGAPLPDGSGQEAFTLISGGVVASSEALCTTQSATAPVTADDGRLLIHLDNVFYGFGAPPPDREIVQGTGISLINTTSTNTCAGITTHDDYNWEWLQIPVLGASKVSPNGRAMSGDTTITGPAGSARLQWNLTAVREP